MSVGNVNQSMNSLQSNTSCVKNGKAVSANIGAVGTVALSTGAAAVLSIPHFKHARNAIYSLKGDIRRWVEDVSSLCKPTHAIGSEELKVFKSRCDSALSSYNKSMKKGVIGLIAGIILSLGTVLITNSIRKNRND